MFVGVSPLLQGGGGGRKLLFPAATKIRKLEKKGRFDEAQILPLPFPNNQSLCFIQLAAGILQQQQSFRESLIRSAHHFCPVVHSHSHSYSRRARPLFSFFSFDGSMDGC
jgi:hypothetical protein